jgi:hypothetical protein
VSSEITIVIFGAWEVEDIVEENEKKLMIFWDFI